MRPHRSHRSTFGSHLSWRDQIFKWKLDRPCESRRRNRPQKAARTARGFTAEAFETHADTLPLGSVQYEYERASNGFEYYQEEDRAAELVTVNLVHMPACQWPG